MNFYKKSIGWQKSFFDSAENWFLVERLYHDDKKYIKVNVVPYSLSVYSKHSPFKAENSSSSPKSIPRYVLMALKENFFLKKLNQKENQIHSIKTIFFQHP